MDTLLLKRVGGSFFGTSQNRPSHAALIYLPSMAESYTRPDYLPSRVAGNEVQGSGLYQINLKNFPTLDLSEAQSFYRNFGKTKTKPPSTAGHPENFSGT